MRRRGRDATTPAKARSKPRWRFEFTPSKPCTYTGFHEFVSPQATGGLWIVNGAARVFDPGEAVSAPLEIHRVIEWTPGRLS